MKYLIRHFFHRARIWFWRSVRQCRRCRECERPVHPLHDICSFCGAAHPAQVPLGLAILASAPLLGVLAAYMAWQYLHLHVAV